MTLGKKTRSSFVSKHKRINHRVFPHKSGVHRHSCFHLYRQLLGQIAWTPLNGSALLQVIRTEFRQDAELRPHAKIVESLQAGYQTLSVLETLRKAQDDIDTQVRAASKDEELPFTEQNIYFKKEILSSQIPVLNLQLRKLCIKYPKPVIPISDPPVLTTYPGGNKILDRPLPQSAITGTRKVPQLVNASGFTFLRVKKPQPALISKILRDKIAKKTARYDSITALTEMKTLAEDEDAWEDQMFDLAENEGKLEEFEEEDWDEPAEDEHLDNSTIVAFTSAEQPSTQTEYSTNSIPFLGGYKYIHAINFAIKVLHAKIAAEDQKQNELGAKFFEIVQKEKALVMEEKERKKNEGVQKWLERTKMVMMERGVEWEDRSAGKAVEIGDDVDADASDAGEAAASDGKIIKTID